MWKMGQLMVLSDDGGETEWRQMFGKEGEKEGGWKLMDAGMELSGPEKKMYLE